MTREPITIIGAGPAGLTAAIVLRRHGLSVRVFEMSAEVGHRLNGDFQGLENWSSEQDVMGLLTECGLETNFICAPYYGGTIFTPGMAPSVIKSNRAIFYLVKRGPFQGTLDMGLKEQALDAGVEIIFNTRHNGGIGSDIVGTGPQGVNIVAAGMTFTTSLDDRAEVVFDDAIAPKGYAYLLVHRGQGTLATVLYRDFSKGKDCFVELVRLFRETKNIDIKNEKRFTSYGNFFMRTSQVEGKTLYVGESAGFQDGLWGFGLRYAILSGYLAAQSIISGTDYDQLWKERFKSKLEISLVNRFLFEKFGQTGYRYLTRKLGNGNPCEYLRRHYNHSWWKQLLLPLAQKYRDARQEKHNVLS
jgi:flavin-dependent dehydrogenase